MLIYIDVIYFMFNNIMHLDLCRLNVYILNYVLLSDRLMDKDVSVCTLAALLDRP